MKLFELWEKIGVQPLSVTRSKEAVLFVKDCEYTVTGARYDNGLIVGFEAEPIARRVVKSEKYGSHRCPRCDRVLYRSEHYCSQCGQKLDWRDWSVDLTR